MTNINVRKSFIHSYTNDEIPMEFVMKFDKVLQELVDKILDEESIREDYDNEWEPDEEHYTDTELFAEKFSDF